MAYYDITNENWYDFPQGYFNSQPNMVWVSQIGQVPGSSQVQASLDALNKLSNPGGAFSNLPGYKPPTAPGFPTLKSQPIPFSGTNTGGNTNMADGLGGNAGNLQEIDPFAAYLQQKGIPGYGLSPAQDWLANQYNPMYTTNLAQNYLAQMTGQPKTDWATYAGSVNPQTSRTGALAALRQGAALPGQEQQAMQDLFSSDELRAFVRNALASVVGQDLATRMVQRLGGLQAQYTVQTQGEGNTFLDYMRQKFGL